MKLTNKKNLPDVLYRAIADDTYSKGDADFSVTELLQPPRVRALKLKHWNELEEDASDRLWAFYGKVAHKIVESFGDSNEVTEVRYFRRIVVNGKTYTISGQVDSLHLANRRLTDWKFTSAYAVKGPPKPEWVAQLNIQAWLLDGKHKVESLEIGALLRDWRDYESKKSPKYPQTQVVMVPIEKWKTDVVEMLIRDLIEMHVDALNVLPECTPEDTWNDRRCVSYCVASKFCEQFQSKLPT